MEPSEASKVPQLLPRRGPRASLCGPKAEERRRRTRPPPSGFGLCLTLFLSFLCFHLGNSEEKGSLGSHNTLVPCCCLFSCQNFSLNSVFFFQVLQFFMWLKWRKFTFIGHLLCVRYRCAGASPNLISFILSQPVRCMVTPPFTPGEEGS